MSFVLVHRKGSHFIRSFQILLYEIEWACIKNYYNSFAFNWAKMTYAAWLLTQQLQVRLLLQQQQKHDYWRSSFKVICSSSTTDAAWRLTQQLQGRLEQLNCGFNNIIFRFYCDLKKIFLDLTFNVLIFWCCFDWCCTGNCTESCRGLRCSCCSCCCWL